VIAPGPLEGVGTFVRGGIDHILSGMDHVLFVACLVMGATGVGALASRITGFTLGHSVTLAAGFFGFAPRMA
jgi:HupE / UreJ protein